jgi:hypothetical protein
MRKVQLYHLPAQADFYDCSDLFAAFVGGVGYGKSYVAADWILTLACLYPQARLFIFSNTYTQLRAGTLRTFFERCDHWGIKYVDRVHLSKEIDLPELGAMIEVRSQDQPINYKSLEICAAWIDEAQAWDKDTYDLVINRLRGTSKQRALYPKMPLAVRITANPPHTMDHWLVDLTTVPDPKTGKPPITLFTAATYDNPYLPQSYIDGLLSQYDPEVAEIELGGKFGNVGTGRIWRRFSRAKHMITDEAAKRLGLPPLEWDPNLPVCWSHDFNNDPLCSILFQWRNVRVAGFQREVMYVLDELRIRSAIIDDAVKEFQNRPAAQIARRNRKLKLYGDPSGAAQRNRQTDVTDFVALKQGLARAGYAGVVENIASVAPSLKSRYYAGNTMLENAKGEIGVVIHPRCVYLPKDLERMFYKPGTGEPYVPPQKIGDPPKLLTHLADAWSYPIAQEHPVMEKAVVPVRQSQ